MCVTAISGDARPGLPQSGQSHSESESLQSPNCRCLWNIQHSAAIESKSLAMRRINRILQSAYTYVHIYPVCHTHAHLIHHHTHSLISSGPAFHCLQRHLPTSRPLMLSSSDVAQGAAPNALQRATRTIQHSIPDPRQGVPARQMGVNFSAKIWGCTLHIRLSLAPRGARFLFLYDHGGRCNLPLSGSFAHAEAPITQRRMR